MTSVAPVPQADRTVRARLGRADLPDLGAHLRLQPGVRALPVVLGQTGPARTVHRQCKAIIDELERMQVFYVNIGGGEPTVRPDFWELVDYATAHHVGVKFSTNGVRITPEVAARLAASDYVDVQISLDGATAEVNDAVRGAGLIRHGGARAGKPGRRRLRRRQDLGGGDPPQRRPTRRLQGAGRPVRRHTADHQAAPLGPGRRRLGRRCIPPPTSRCSSTTGWSPRATGCSPATRSSTWRRSATAGRAEHVRRRPGGLPDRPRRRRLRLPVRHPRPVPGREHPADNGFDNVWKNAPLFRELREPQSAGACGSCGHYDACRGGCMAAKFFTGLPLDGPDPECVEGTASRRWPATAKAAAPGRPFSGKADPADRCPREPPAHRALQRKPGLVMARRYLVRNGRRSPSNAPRGGCPSPFTRRCLPAARRA